MERYLGFWEINKIISSSEITADEAGSLDFDKIDSFGVLGQIQMLIAHFNRDDTICSWEAAHINYRFAVN